MKGRHLITIFIAIGILSGCGSLTKMRYSHGFKSNFEISIKKKKNEVPRIFAKKATKLQSKTDIIPFITLTDNSILWKNDSNTNFVKVSNKIIKPQPKYSENIQKAPNLGKQTAIKIRPLHTTRIFEPYTNLAILSFILCLGFGLIAFLFLQPALLFPAFLIGEIAAILSLLLVFCTFILSIISLNHINHASVEYSGTTIDIILILLTAPVVLYLLFIGGLILLSIF